MAYKTFTAGSVALASDINTYLMNQSVMVFTNSTTRDATLTAPTEGMVAYLTASDHYTIYNGTAWVIFDIAWNAWTPTITGITLGTSSSIACYYARIGKTVVMTGKISFGANASAVTAITLTLPVNAFGSGVYSTIMGMCLMNDATGGSSYVGHLFTSSATSFTLRAQNAAGTYATSTPQSATVPFTWASAGNHSLVFTATYQSV